MNVTTCKHFTGTQHKKCALGIEYDSFRPASLPCLGKYNKDGTACPKLELPSEAELAAYAAHTRNVIQGIGIARNAILDDLDRRHNAGDATVRLNPQSQSEYDDAGPTDYLSGAGSIPCPICKIGELHYSRAAHNGHVHAGCTTKDCVRWME